MIINLSAPESWADFPSDQGADFYRNIFNHIDPLKQVINEDVRYYNKERIQLKLKRLSSIQYQAQSFK